MRTPMHARLFQSLIGSLSTYVELGPAVGGSAFQSLIGSLSTPRVFVAGADDKVGFNPS